jgi:beta propeller repeat protein
MEAQRTALICAAALAGLFPVAAFGFEAFAIYPSPQLQQFPDVDNGLVVWQQRIEFEGVWDWDIFGVDLLDASAPKPIEVAWLESDQQKPSVWNRSVVWQHEYAADDWDVYLTDITDAEAPVWYLLNAQPGEYENNQTEPAIHGNTVVWQHEYIDPDTLAADWDIYAADVTNPDSPYVFRPGVFVYNQQAPAVWRDTVVWQDDDSGMWDIGIADIWLKNDTQDRMYAYADLNQENPVIWDNWLVFEVDYGDGDYDIHAADLSVSGEPSYSLVDLSSKQINPDISGHLVVWQDNRDGNWDIYGYNLITRTEFPITTDPADQINPAISGALVVWQDKRITPANIYYTWLDGEAIADCPTGLVGDTDGDCRVNLTDFVLMAENWLACGLEPVDACVP